MQHNSRHPLSSMLDISAMHISKSSNYIILFYTKKKNVFCALAIELKISQLSAT